MSAPRSRTTCETPARESPRDVARPAGPAPTMIASTGKQRCIVPIPVALKEAVRIVLPLEREERLHVRVAALDLIAARPPVIREVEASAACDAEVDELAKHIGGFGDGRRRVIDVKIEDDARV